MARMARILHEADGLFKSRCILFQAATLKPFCGVDDMVSKLFPSKDRIAQTKTTNTMKKGVRNICLYILYNVQWFFLFVAGYFFEQDYKTIKKKDLKSNNQYDYPKARK